MPEGYCVKCKAKKEVVDAVETVMKNGRKAIKGKCPDCATAMFKILGEVAKPPGGDSTASSGSSPVSSADTAGAVVVTLPPITGSGGSKAKEGAGS